ncbi:MAG: tyrosine phenol-lyase [Elusimicrobia bacterium GWF2_52_66]|nr:MAG: tyrosine phenol-lyase [Elusimicrobia bacterium GWA2_51_34]OGR86074.1 MAG: tyrosine phenol-lyase [Elusimicrobia bacterium GWF2_52_66]HAF94584.1 tyrosine phenol-lyase [Elusimicrobiota bacterium]HCE98082.1 tyrosine phenol-lyase [Elusimicrobiota bacterium]
MEHKWKTIIEPFKIKSVEPLGFTTREERLKLLEQAHYNLFNIRAEKVLIDLLTDSGTGAMSAAQWGGIMTGDESYAGARSYYNFENEIKDLTGYREVIPVHQGRAAERILFSVIGGQGKYMVSNSHFDTTRANVEASGAAAIDFPASGALDFDKPGPFKGNMNTTALEKFISKTGAKNIPLCIMTVTNNSLGGQPVSMENLKSTQNICRKYGIPMFLDCARFAENAYFIKLREKGYSRTPVREIAQEMFELADGAMMSAKKDAFANMGGFLAMNNTEWSGKARQMLILTEGFNTYGGLAGRDLEAIAIGLREVLDENYLQYRIRSSAYLGEGLTRRGVPIVTPPGGHGIYVNAKKFLPHINPRNFPAQTLATALYLEGGIRGVEIGTLMFGRRDAKGNFLPASMELLRLAVPRRVYTQSHIDYVIEVFGCIAKNKKSLKGLEIVEAPKVLAHFSAKLRPVK